MSDIGEVADAVRVACAKAAANAQSAIGMVQTLATSFSVQMEVATAKAMGEMEKRVRQVASYSDAQTSQATAMLR